jgi:hypothetical protein
MQIYIYIQSNLFKTENANSNLCKQNANHLFALDAIDNGLEINNINTETILALIADHIKDTEPQNYGEELLPFDGGLFIEHDGKRIASNCCGDISNIENWRTILSAINTNWETLWIGHPEIAFKFDENFIYLSDYIEKTDIEIKFKFDKQEFIELLAIKIQQFDAFKEQIFNVIDESNEENYKALKTVLF